MNQKSIAPNSITTIITNDSFLVNKLSSINDPIANTLNKTVKMHILGLDDFL